MAATAIVSFAKKSTVALNKQTPLPVWQAQQEQNQAFAVRPVEGFNRCSSSNPAYYGVTRVIYSPQKSERPTGPRAK